MHVRVRVRVRVLVQIWGIFFLQILNVQFPLRWHFSAKVKR
jgi:hypothetical protein